MTLRATIFLLAAASLSTASFAQITLTRNDLPFTVGTHTITSFETDFEDDEANAGPIGAIIESSGANRLYDFTPVNFGFQGTIVITIENGAVGPGAEIEPFNLANLTLWGEIEEEDDEGEPISATIWNYMRVTDEALDELGAYTLSEEEPDFAVALKRLPEGSKVSQFPLMFGDSWTSEFQEIFEVGGFMLFEVDQTNTLTVDGWGTLRAPGLTADVPVLRVRREERYEQFGTEISEVCYEFRSTAPVSAEVCEGSTFSSPTASVTFFGAGAVATQPEAPGRDVRLHPAYPNPARHEVHLSYDLERDAQVDLKLFDVLGREVREVVTTVQAPGNHSRTIDVSGLAPGLYLARLTVNGAVLSRPVVLVP